MSSKGFVMWIFIAIYFIESEIIFMLANAIPILSIAVPFLLFFFSNKYIDFFLQLDGNSKRKMQIMLQCIHIISVLLMKQHFLLLMRLNVVNQSMGVGTGNALIFLSCCWYILISILIITFELIKIRNSKYEK